MIDCTVDSGTLIDALRRKSEALAALSRSAEIGISHVALGEILVGVFKQNNRTELDKVREMVAGMTLLSVDSQTSAVYATIRADLERQGRMIPQNDLWIAVAAIQADVPLITNDEHFSRIQRLRVISY